MKLTRNIILMIVLTLIAGPNANAAKTVIKLSGVPEKILFPMEKGANIIITANINSNKVKSVWLAPEKNSSARVMLTMVSTGEYRINLADPMVEAILKQSEPNIFHIFAELSNNKIIKSIPVNYGIKKAVNSNTFEYYIVSKSSRQKVKVSFYDVKNAVYPDTVEYLEISYKPSDATIEATAEIGSREWQFTPVNEYEGILKLALNNEMKQEWKSLGYLEIKTEESSKPLIIQACQDSLEITEFPFMLTIKQRDYADIPGSREILSIYFGDISKGKVNYHFRKHGLYTNTLHHKELSKGDIIEIPFGSAIYKLALIEMVNYIIGDDYIVVLVYPEKITEKQKIRFLVKALEGSDVTLMHQGGEYKGYEAGKYLSTLFETDKMNNINEFLTKAEMFKGDNELIIKRKNDEGENAFEWFKKVRDDFLVEE